jgi:hypothetical protein
VTAWDHQPFYPDVGKASEGQQQAGGYNRDNNCVPTTWTVTAKAYRGPHIEPQAITDLTYGKTFHGGEDYGPTIATLRRLWPECPDVHYANPDDSLAGIDAEGAQGHGVACSFHCDGYGVLQFRSTGIRHVCAILGHHDGQVIILNSEHMELNALTEQQFRGASSGVAGEMAFFQRDLATAQPHKAGDMATPYGLKIGVIFLFRGTYFGEWPSDWASVSSYADQISDDFSNITVVFDAMKKAWSDNHGPDVQWRHVDASEQQLRKEFDAFVTLLKPKTA